MKFFLSLFFLSTSLLFITSCKKNPGPGGSASITGKIYAIERNSFGTSVDSFFIAKEDVYIIYGGESTIFDDDIETSYDGSFRFKNLEPGNYQVFVYSKCLAAEGCPDGKQVIIKDVTIDKKKQTVDLGTVTIYK